MKMNLKKTVVAAIGSLTIAFASFGISAMEVTFSDIIDTDLNSASGYDPTATLVDGLDGNVLNLGVLPFTINSPTVEVMTDALNVTITAPEGFEITSVSYTESGNYNALSGYAAATIQLIADTEEFGIQGPAPGFQGFGSSAGGWGPLSQEIIFADGVGSADISISNQLFVGNASISKSSASLTVELQAVPLPPALWMLGSAVLGLIAVRRRS